MKRQFGAELDVQLIPGSGGIFEIAADQGMLFSKKKLGRFPDPGEVASLVARKIQK